MWKQQIVEGNRGIAEGKTAKKKYNKIKRRRRNLEVIPTSHSHTHSNPYLGFKLRLKSLKMKKSHSSKAPGKPKFSSFSYLEYMLTASFQDSKI